MKLLIILKIILVLSGFGIYLLNGHEVSGIVVQKIHRDAASEEISYYSPQQDAVIHYSKKKKEMFWLIINTGESEQRLEVVKPDFDLYHIGDSLNMHAQ